MIDSDSSSTLDALYQQAVAGKLYCDFTAKDQYPATLEKLLRRLQLSSV